MPYSNAFFSYSCTLNISFSSLNLTAENTSRVVFDYYLEDEKWNSFLNEEERDIYIKDCLKNSDQVQQEDDFICNAVQRGLESSGYDVGRYAPKVEMADHQFHLLLAQNYHNHFNEKSTTTIAKK